MLNRVLCKSWRVPEFKFFLAVGLTTILNPNSGWTQSLNQAFYSKVEVLELSEMIVTVDSLYIDTLLMHDNSKLTFINDTKIIIERAFIGKKCQFDARGIDGRDGTPVEADGISKGSAFHSIHGSGGTDGKSILAIIVFEELGSLTVNTSGGNGGKGADGYYGGQGKMNTLNSGNGAAAQNHAKGGNGGVGGNAGNGGNLHLHYFCNGFTPRLETNPESKATYDRSLRLFHYAGKGGSGGQGGSGWVENTLNNSPAIIGESVTRTSLAGLTGSDGVKGRDGELLFRKMEN